MTVMIHDIFLLKPLFAGLLYHDMASPYRWIVMKYKTFNKPRYCSHFRES